MVAAEVKDEDVVLVTGGTGCVGHAVQEIITLNPPRNEKWVFVGRKDADLTSYEATKILFNRVQPTKVLHLAAMVGGLFANMVSNSTCASWARWFDFTGI